MKQNCQIREELGLQINATLFWTDSTCVLQYINNEAGRFKTFVANRIATIHNGSRPSQLRHVSSELNPADYASRGLSSTNQREINQWINGPSFLRKTEESWPNRLEGINVMSDDKLEWKRNVEIYETQAEEIKPLDTFDSSSIILPGIAFKKELCGLSVLSIIFAVVPRLTQALPVVAMFLGPA